MGTPPPPTYAHPTPTPIYHITPIVNLGAIAAAGVLYSKTELIRRGLAPANISYDSIQRRRAIRPVTVGSGGTLHDYVPFHFAPRSPMLDTINRGNVPGCDYRQKDIVHLLMHAQPIVAAGLPFAFSDYHAVLDWANFYDNLRDLNRINWPLFFEAPLVGGYCRYYFSDETKPKYARRRETRQAEFLVHTTVPIGQVIHIAVLDAGAERRVNEQLAGSHWAPPIVIQPGWYH